MLVVGTAAGRITIVTSGTSRSSAHHRPRGKNFKRWGLQTRSSGRAHRGDCAGPPPGSQDLLPPRPQPCPPARSSSAAAAKGYLQLPTASAATPRQARVMVQNIFQTKAFAGRAESTFAAPPGNSFRLRRGHTKPALPAQTAATTSTTVRRPTGRVCGSSRAVGFASRASLVGHSSPPSSAQAATPSAGTRRRLPQTKRCQLELPRPQPQAAWPPR